METCYKMATKASHRLGDISREQPDLCVVHEENADDFIGEWVTGFCFFNVRFPKSTTRDLDEDEKQKWNGVLVVIGRTPIGTVNTK